MKKIRVLFVCMGNICRSPTAHGVFESLIKREHLDQCIEVDSAGTHAYHVGERPDKRSQATALAQGYDLSSQQSRLITEEDFVRFNYILAMDKPNLHSLRNVNKDQSRVHALMDFAPSRVEDEVPDPYYGGDQGFENVLTMVEVAARGLLDHIITHDLNEPT